MGNESMIKRNMCFSCDLWTNRIEDSNKDNKMIVDHIFYSVAREDDKSSSRGFGGAKFTFVKNGKTIISTNVWYGGDIPHHFWTRTPDNAIIVK